MRKSGRAFRNTMTVVAQGWCLLEELVSLCLLCTARLAQSVEHETLNLRVVGSSPTLGVCFCGTHELVACLLADRLCPVGGGRFH